MKQGRTGGERERKTRENKGHQRKMKERQRHKVLVFLHFSGIFLCLLAFLACLGVAAFLAFSGFSAFLGFSVVFFFFFFSLAGFSCFSRLFLVFLGFSGFSDFSIGCLCFPGFSSSFGSAFSDPKSLRPWTRSTRCILVFALHGSLTVCGRRGPPCGTLAAASRVMHVIARTLCKCGES